MPQFETKTRFFREPTDPNTIIEVTTSTYKGRPYACEMKWLKKRGDSYEYESARRAFEARIGTHGFGGGMGKLYDILVDIKTGDTYQSKKPIDALTADKELKGWRFYANPATEKIRQFFEGAQELSAQEIAALKKKIKE